MLILFPVGAGSKGLRGREIVGPMADLETLNRVVGGVDVAIREGVVIGLSISQGGECCDRDPDPDLAAFVPKLKKTM